MAAWQIESDVCHGRGFVASDATGMLAKFYTWVTKAPASGGPGWTILLDKSANPVLTTFTVPDHLNDKCYAVAHGLYTGELIVLSNVGGALPSPLTATTYYVIKVDADNFKVATSFLNAQIGTQVNITSAGTGTHSFILNGPYIIVSDQAAPTVNQVCKIIKVGYVSTEAAFVRVQYWLGWDNTNKILYGLWSGHKLNTYDSSDFAYDFRGGPESLIIQSRLGTLWYTALIDDWVGDANLVEGIDKTGTLASGVTAGTNVVLTLGSSGEANNFTVNKYYYIYDFNAHSWVNYVKCVGVGVAGGLNADQIRVDSITDDFPSGSVIAAYTHRFYTMGEAATYDADCNISGYKCHIPYVGAAVGCVFHDQAATYIYGNIILDKMINYLGIMSPNDEGIYAVQKPSLCENARYVDGLTTGMNRCYGILKNVYITNLGAMAAAQDGRVIGGKNYLYFRTEASLNSGGSANYALLFLDTEAAS